MISHDKITAMRSCAPKHFSQTIDDLFYYLYFLLLRKNYDKITVSYSTSTGQGVLLNIEQAYIYIYNLTIIKNS